MRDKIELSIIVPIYKGNMYLPKLILNLEQSVSKLDINAEVIIVNDYPEEELKETYSTCFKVIYLYNETNIGIHGTRLRGLSIAKGTYIHFLDQDDQMEENFYQTQISKIGLSDAIVSKVNHYNKDYYSTDFNFQKITDLKYLIEKGNYIVTPGQVIIKKKSIPQRWKDLVIKTNGSDDYFLWICMAYEKKVMVYNDETTFYHIQNINGNASDNIINMKLSVNEVFLNCLNNYFDVEAQEIIWNALKSEAKKEQRLMNIKRLLERWMTNRDYNNTISDYLRLNNIERVSIYGAGIFGHHLYYEIKDNIEISFIFDRKIKKMDNVDVINFTECPQSGQIIIVSMVGDNTEIIKVLKEYGNTVLELQQIIDECYIEREQFL